MAKRLDMPLDHALDGALQVEVEGGVHVTRGWRERHDEVGEMHGAGRTGIGH
jgi:hypothetical protein